MTACSNWVAGSIISLLGRPVVCFWNVDRKQISYAIEIPLGAGVKSVRPYNPSESAVQHSYKCNDLCGRKTDQNFTSLHTNGK